MVDELDYEKTRQHSLNFCTDSYVQEEVKAISGFASTL